jgi:hypothetical protein
MMALQGLLIGKMIEEIVCYKHVGFIDQKQTVSDDGVNNVYKHKLYCFIVLNSDC